MKTKEIYNAPEMESILLIKEAVMLDSSDGINSANNGYDNDNDMGEIGG
ncbi:MAG: hypothetical protein IJK32_08550 [Bacteroidales bacterium]|nr:hypothetical protein [Bacteroidales bacterium]